MRRDTFPGERWKESERNQFGDDASYFGRDGTTLAMMADRILHPQKPLSQLFCRVQIRSGLGGGCTCFPSAPTTGIVARSARNAAHVVIICPLAKSTTRLCAHHFLFNFISFSPDWHGNKEEMTFTQLNLEALFLIVATLHSILFILSYSSPKSTFSRNQ